ncbi:MAG TPA: PilZ domain-containing protein [Candidatus Acidoferrum sp.]|nr:PilZ domain-containing protein [Candidatus Acidoferrum sp.]
MDGRKEKRTPRTLRVLLSSGAQPVVAEHASIENVSSYGARVLTDRPWKPDASILIKSAFGEPLARARVVYCQTLKAHTFAVGLEFLTRTHDWLLSA